MIHPVGPYLLLSLCIPLLRASNTAELLHDEKVKAGIYTKANLVDSSSIPRTAEQLKKAILRNIEAGEYEGMNAVLTDAEHEVEIYLNKQFAEVNVSDATWTACVNS